MKKLLFALAWLLTMGLSLNLLSNTTDAFNNLKLHIHNIEVDDKNIHAAPFLELTPVMRTDDRLPRLASAHTNQEMTLIDKVGAVVGCAACSIALPFTMLMDSHYYYLNAHAKPGDLKAAIALDEYNTVVPSTIRNLNFKVVGSASLIGILAAVNNKMQGIDTTSKKAALTTALSSMLVTMYHNYSAAQADPAGLYYAPNLSEQSGLYNQTSLSAIGRIATSLAVTGCWYLLTSEILKPKIAYSELESLTPEQESMQSAREAHLLQHGEW